jgi:hypothetical protein
VVAVAHSRRSVAAVVEVGALVGEDLFQFLREGLILLLLGPLDPEIQVPQQQMLPQMEGIVSLFLLSFCLDREGVQQVRLRTQGWAEFLLATVEETVDLEVLAAAPTLAVVVEPVDTLVMVARVVIPITLDLQDLAEPPVVVELVGMPIALVVVVV